MPRIFVAVLGLVCAVQIQHDASAQTYNNNTRVVWEFVVFVALRNLNELVPPFDCEA